MIVKGIFYANNFNSVANIPNLLIPFQTRMLLFLVKNEFWKTWAAWRWSSGL